LIRFLIDPINVCTALKLRRQYNNAARASTGKPSPCWMFFGNDRLALVRTGARPGSVMF
jgi:hypothetical protein